MVVEDLNKVAKGKSDTDQQATSCCTDTSKKQEERPLKAGGINALGCLSRCQSKAHNRGEKKKTSVY